MVQLKKYEPELKAMGYQIICVSPDKPEELIKIADKNKLPYTFLSDSKMEAATAYGLAFKLNQKKPKERLTGAVVDKYSGEKHRQLPVPAVFLIGADQVIDFVYANPDYTVRIEPEVLLAEAEKALK